jgi:protein XRP2
MPPKPQVFKSPDGKEFSTKAEWRDYMMSTFYSFKNKENEAEPLVKMPGTVDGQIFDIADCKNCSLAVLDHTEQVQIDNVDGCRIFIGACASSIFIRNCSNCVFYTCCRQLRLREVNKCTFYIFSMAEVHIEYSSELKFAPFNGGYPEHADHLATAKLDVSHNLWYDVYDHNDPSKSHVNWALLPENEYEDPWFPVGICEPAVPRTKCGSVQIPPPENQNMQSFSVQQMIQDAEKLNILPPSAPAGDNQSDTSAVSAAVPVDIDEERISNLLRSFTNLNNGQSIDVSNNLGVVYF